MEPAAAAEHHAEPAEHEEEVATVLTLLTPWRPKRYGPVM